eukprot:197609_1
MDGTNNIELDTIAQTVLDNYCHLLHNHNTENEFEIIVNRLQQCNLDQCKLFKRNMRYEKPENEYNVFMNIMDKIHVYFLHSMDIGYRLSATQKHEIVADLEENNEPKLINKKIIDINEFLKSQKHISNSKMLSARMRRYNQLQKQSLTKSGLYSFGFLFKYGNDDCYADNYDILVQPKYSSLKEELLQNKLYRLTNISFENEYKKAVIHLNSYYCRKYYRIMSVEYVLTLMIYCNYDDLQHQFSRTYRENIKLHGNFYHLGKLLKIAVHQFGTLIKDEVPVQQFYHGIQEELIFPRYINDIYIHGPLSTSLQFEVAINFANRKGLVLEFTDTIGYIKYFPASWLSDYGHEKECVFIQNTYSLKLKSILNVETGTDYAVILQALNIIDKLMSTERIQVTETDAMIHLITAIISHQFSLLLTNFTTFKSLDGYAKNIIDTYFENKLEIRINIQQLQQYHTAFKDIIFGVPTNAINLLSILFPQLQFVRIETCNEVVESIIIGVLDYFQKHQKISMEWIEIALSDLVSDSIKLQILSIWEPQFGQMNFKITTKNELIYISKKHCRNMKQIQTKIPLNTNPKYSQLSRYFHKNVIISNLIMHTYIWNTKLMDIIECFLENQITDSYFNTNHQEKFRDTLDDCCPKIISEFIWNFMARDKVSGSLTVVNQVEDNIISQSLDIDELNSILMEGSQSTDEITIEGDQNVILKQLDDKTFDLLQKLQSTPMLIEFKKFIIKTAYGYDWIMDDILHGEQQSKILSMFGHKLYSEIKSQIVINNTYTSTGSFKQYRNSLIGCHGACGSPFSAFINDCTQKQIHSFKKYSKIIEKQFWFCDSPMRVLLAKQMEKKAICQLTEYQKIHEELTDEICFIRGDIWADKISSLFIKLFNDNHLDILQAMANASCKINKRSLFEEIAAFNEMHNGNVLHNTEQYEKRLIAIKQKREYKIMKENNLELSNSELASIMLFCNGGLIANELRKSHEDGDDKPCHWKHLSTCLLSALHKIYMALHLKNEQFKNEYIDTRNPRDNKLFHGVRDVSLANDNIKHLFMHTVTSFTEDFSVGNQYAYNGMILVIDDAYKSIYNGKLKAANVSWISHWGKREMEWILLPTEFINHNKLDTTNDISDCLVRHNLSNQLEITINEIYTDNKIYKTYIGRAETTKIYEISVFTIKKVKKSIYGAAHETKQRQQEMMSSNQLEITINEIYTDNKIYKTYIGRAETTKIYEISVFTIKKVKKSIYGAAHETKQRQQEMMSYLGSISCVNTNMDHQITKSGKNSEHINHNEFDTTNAVSDRLVINNLSNQLEITTQEVNMNYSECKEHIGMNVNTSQVEHTVGSQLNVNHIHYHFHSSDLKHKNTDTEINKSQNDSTLHSTNLCER